MDHFTLSLCVGAAAGALDVLPKVFQGASARSCFSAFFIFLFSAVIVFHADLPYLPWWADGMGTTLMLSIPVFFTLAGKERKTIPVFVFDALLCGGPSSRRSVFFGPTSVQYRRPAPYSRETACQAEPRPPMTSTAAAWRTTECAR